MFPFAFRLGVDRDPIAPAHSSAPRCRAHGHRGAAPDIHEHRPIVGSSPSAAHPPGRKPPPQSPSAQTLEEATQYLPEPVDLAEAPYVFQRFGVLAVIVAQRLDRHVESDPTPEAMTVGHRPGSAKDPNGDGLGRLAERPRRPSPDQCDPRGLGQPAASVDAVGRGLSRIGRRAGTGAGAGGGVGGSVGTRRIPVRSG